MKNGIKPITDYNAKHYLYLRMKILDIQGGCAAMCSVELRKYFSDYASPDHGASHDHLPKSSESGGIAAIIKGSTKSDILEKLE